MPINPAIAMSFQAPKFEDPMNNLIKMEQIKAYQQNALAKQLEAEIAQESLGQQRGLSNYLAGLEPGASPDMNMLARFGKTGREYGKDITEARSKQIEMASKLYKEKYLPILAQARTRDDVLAWHGLMEKDPEVQPILTPQGKAMLPKSDAEVPSYLETTLVPLSDIFKRETMKQRIAGEQGIARERIEAANRRAEMTAGRPFNIDGSLISPAGEIIYKGNQQTVVSPGSTVLKDGVPIYTAPTAPKQTVVSPGSTVLKDDVPIYTAPPSPQKPTDEISNYEYYANQEKQFGRQPRSFEQWQKLNSTSEIKPPSGYRVTESGDLEAIPGGPADPEVFANKLTQKQKIEYKQSYDGAKKQLNNFVTSIDQNIALIDSLLKNEEGLDAMFGGVNQYKPSMLMSDQTRDALGNYEQLIDKSVLTELTNLRLSSPTGGALGNVTDREGTRLEVASAGLQRYLSKNSAISSLNRYKKELELAKRNIEGAFKDTYSFLFDDQVNLLNDKGKPSGLLTKKPIEPKPSGVDLDEVDKIVGIGR